MDRNQTLWFGQIPAVYMNELDSFSSRFRCFDSKQAKMISAYSVLECKRVISYYLRANELGREVIKNVDDKENKLLIFRKDTFKSVVIDASKSKL